VHRPKVNVVEFRPFFHPAPLAVEARSNEFWQNRSKEFVQIGSSVGRCCQRDQRKLRPTTPVRAEPTTDLLPVEQAGVQFAKRFAKGRFFGGRQSAGTATEVWILPLRLSSTSFATIAQHGGICDCEESLGGGLQTVRTAASAAHL